MSILKKKIIYIYIYIYIFLDIYRGMIQLGPRHAGVTTISAWPMLAPVFICLSK